MYPLHITYIYHRNENIAKMKRKRRHEMNMMNFILLDIYKQPHSNITKEQEKKEHHKHFTFETIAATTSLIYL